MTDALKVGCYFDKAEKHKQDACAGMKMNPVASNPNSVCGRTCTGCSREDFPHRLVIIYGQNSEEGMWGLENPQEIFELKDLLFFVFCTAT